ncbi:PLAC8 family, putative [Leishmania donovani]|uniref:PLAC8 family, putative n=1 Tax=Leishmania donovani TaxID=5661 RepID=A0A451EJC3_LEIDO|nr:PLAC8 family, putative [Leishmania donovani]
MSKSDLANDAQVPMRATVLRFGDDVEGASYPEAALAIEDAAVPAEAEVDVCHGRDSSGGDHESVPHPAQTPRHDFTSGILDCHESCAVCLDACLCMYCTASAHHNFLINDTEGIYLPVCWGLFCVDVGLSAVSSYLPSSLHFHTYFMRSAIRSRYNLHSAGAPVNSNTHGSSSSSSGCGCSTESISDLLTVWFCLPCAVAQHQREIMHQGDWCGGVFSNRYSLQAPATVHTV